MSGLFMNTNRGFRRKSLSPEDNYAILIDPLNKSFELTDLTSNGASFLIENKFTHSLSEKLEGGHFKCQLLLNGVKIGTSYNALICHVNPTNDGFYKVGVRLTDSTMNPDNTSRSQQRWDIVEDLWPTGNFENPLVLNEWIHFRIENISASGCLATASARNNLLVKGTKLERVTIFLPTIGRFEADCEILRVRKIEDQDRIQIGLRFNNLSTSDQGLIARYILAFGKGLPEQKISIFKFLPKPKKIKSNFRYEIVSTEADYQSVLNLRLEAYKRAGKVNAESSKENMADKYDAHSKIIVAKLGEMVVASIRYTYCSSAEHRFELDESITIPKKFERNKTLEASRACVRPEFENTDLIHGLFEFGTQIAVKLEAKWILSSCEEKLLKLYSRLGMTNQDQVFHLKTLGNIPHYLIAGNLETISTSKGLNPIIWHYSYGNVARFLVKLGYIKKLELPLLKRVSIKVGLAFIHRIKGFRSAQKHRDPQ